MWPDLPWNATSTGSLTRPPLLPETTAKKTIPLQKSHANSTEKWDSEGRGKSIINIQAHLEASLEPATHPDVRGVPQWSIPSFHSFSSLTSLPAQQPMRIRPGLISRTSLIPAGFISGPIPASARNPQPDLVETTSPGLTSPSPAHSDLIKTTSLGRPVGYKQQLLHDWPLARSYLLIADHCEREIRPCTDPSMHCIAWRRDRRRGGAARSRCNFPHPAWRPSSSYIGNPLQHSRTFWAKPVPWHAW